jgi:hypothetical protein
VSERYTWKTHAWRYPRIDWDRFEERSFLDGPDVLLLSSYDFSQVQRTLASGKLGADYVLAEEHRRDWYRYSSPSARMFRFYDELLNIGTAPYELARSFRVDARARIVFAPPEIRIYRRTTPDATGGPL